VRHKVAKKSALKQKLIVSPQGAHTMTLREETSKTEIGNCMGLSPTNKTPAKTPGAKRRRQGARRTAEGKKAGSGRVELKGRIYVLRNFSGRTGVREHWGRRSLFGNTDHNCIEKL